MRQGIRHGAYAGNRGAEGRPASVPAENVVVPGGFAAGGFDEGDAGQQAPVERIGVGGLQKGGRKFGHGTVAPLEKCAQAGQAGVVVRLVPIFGCGWLSGTSVGGGDG